MRSTRAASGWKLTKLPSRPSGKGRRRSVAIGDGVPEQFLQSKDVEVAETYEATPAAAAARRGAATPDLTLDVPLGPGETGLVAVRHASGALTFHRSVDAGPSSSSRRSARTPSRTLRFQIPVRDGAAQGAPASTDGARRGVVSKALKVFVLKIAKSAVDRVTSVVLPKLAETWERRTWNAKGLSEGWFHVAPTGGSAPRLRLDPAVPEPGKRSLVFLHGTFSNADGAFGALAGTDFFDRVRPIYDDRIYAFNHFSVSRTPAENVAQMLAALPDASYQIDVITHSRGGLVLRNLVEGAAARAARVNVGRAVLVAAPNEGTPLATPSRWEETVGWFANLMEMFPDHPFTTGAEYVSEAIVWLASHLANDLPGLRSMDGAGAMVGELQGPPGPRADSYSALVSNFHPESALWARAVDCGIDSFFASANDLVVPSEGGWRVDRDGFSYVPADRIGCFGPGGNLDSGSTQVHHLNFFGRSETVAFLANALEGKKQALAPVDPNAPLPDRRFAGGVRRAIAPADALATSPVPATDGPARPQATTAAPAPSYPQDVFQIVVLTPFEDPGDRELEEQKTDRRKTRRASRSRGRFVRVLASFAGARVESTMQIEARPGEPPTAFEQIEEYHRRIKAYTNDVGEAIPEDKELIEFGTLLFDTLFQGDVLRLYDEARSRQRGSRLNFIFTSMVPEIADKPWEFTYDESRRSFLATEDIHFVRNVLTAVPAEAIEKRIGPLRILVAAALPVGYVPLSIDQEIEVIRRGFDSLVEAGLVAVDVLSRATPSKLHGYLSTGNYDVVHFIGHGVFDDQKQEGFLAFEDARGGVMMIGERAAREIFCQRGVKLAFLNACQTGQGGTGTNADGKAADFNKGIAQSLVAHGLPALVANQYSVRDSTATDFARHFYWSLAQGLTIGESAREARIAVNYSLSGDPLDWAVPVVYARDACDTLASRTGELRRDPPSAVTLTSRRAIAKHRWRIAVWDVDYAFPSLGKTLQSLNSSQNRFGFEAARLSLPLDVWYRHGSGKEATRYLWANRLARRLQNKVVDLRVNLLIAITQHPLCDNDTINLYAWWPELDEDKERVAVISCAEIGLAAEGPETDRAIANATVSILAGFFGSFDSHVRGANDCPFSYNEARDVRILVGKQKFDPGCRRKVSRAIPDEAAALEALLRVFD